MSRVRHDIGGAKPSESAGSGKRDKAGGPLSDKAQKIKLIVAVSVLLVAGVLIVTQSGIFAGTPTPLAAQPGAELDDNQNPDNPGEPPPKSNFSRRAQPVR